MAMTRPRRVVPGVCYLITRRCSERRFFLRPDSKVAHIFEYLLAFVAKTYGIEVHAFVVMSKVAHIFEYLLAFVAKTYGIEVHAFVVMSNHYHLVITDTQGRLPDFQRD